MDIKFAKPLEGRVVLITYRNRHGHISKMDPKRVVHAEQNRMKVDEGHVCTDGGKQFHLYCQGIQSIDLYVDVARVGETLTIG